MTTDTLSESQKQLMSLAVFVLEFAQVEKFLFQTLTTLGSVSDEFARAALSGVRGDAAIGYLRRLFKISSIDADRQKEYEEVFAHFAPINEARNLILHHGVDGLGLGFVASNRARALRPEDTRSIPVSSEILNQMTDDLSKMTAILLVNLFPDRKAEFSLDVSNAQDLRRPWRYTPPPQPDSQKRAAPKDPPQHKKQQRPPKSSRK